MPRSLAALGLAIALASVLVPQRVIADSPGLAGWDSGSIGIYADSSATSVCAQIPEGGYAILPVIAILGPDFFGDLAGVEFRIEVSNPEGWQISYRPPDDGILIGDPLDFLPQERRDPSGATLAFPICRSGDAAGRVGLGSLFVWNRGGQPTELRVKRRSMPTSRTNDCALFTQCIDPYYSAWCVTPHNAGACAQLVVPQAVRVGQGCDDPYFVAALNREVDPRWTAPPRPHEPHREVLAFLTRRDHIELPEGEVEARLPDAFVRPPGLRAVLHDYGVQWVGKGMPCFDLADTVGVSRTGEVIRLTDWSRLWVFSIPPSADIQRFIAALEGLREVLYAEPNGSVAPTSVVDEAEFRAPNPLVAPGEVQLLLAVPTQARIDVYDARGHWVRELANARLPAGPTNMSWDGLGASGSRLPSGVYFVHVTVGSQQSVHKLIFIR